MNNFLPPDRWSGALCRFGPGGDFQKPWPPEIPILPTEESAGMFGQIGWALGWLAQRLMNIRGDESVRLDHTPLPVVARRVPGGNAGPWSYSHSAASWRTGNENGEEPKNPTSPQHSIAHADASAGADSAFDPRLPSQSWLFADDAGTGSKTPRQQSHGVRARRSPRSKRAAPPCAQQGTLFDA
jgi:hypothetical protein